MGRKVKAIRLQWLIISALDNNRSCAIGLCYSRYKRRGYFNDINGFYKWVQKDAKNEGGSEE
jgi:hypothetical protein